MGLCFKFDAFRSFFHPNILCSKSCILCFWNPFRVRNRNLTLCGRKTFFDEFKNAFCALHWPKSSHLFFPMIVQSFLPLQTFTHPRPAIKITLCFYISNDQNYTETPHRLTQTALKHRKQLKCFLCIFMLLALDKFTPLPLEPSELSKHSVF